MEIKEIHNATKVDLESRKFNIFIAICLGNKFFLNEGSINKENIMEYLTWAFKYTKDKVLFLIADKIKVTNYNVRNNNTGSYNLRRVLREGAKIKEELQDFISKLPEEKRDKIKIIQWEEFDEKDKSNKKTTELIYNEFNNNPEFKREVFNAVEGTMTDRQFKEEKYWEMCNYFLDEFYVIYSGIKYEEDYYGLFFYPNMDPVAFLIEDLQCARKFPELNRKLPKEKVALAIIS